MTATFHLNGEPAELADGATVRSVLDGMGVDADARGIAVAVDGEVVPRSAWAGHALGGGERVEVLTATQGG